MIRRPRHLLTLLLLLAVCGLSASVGAGASALSPAAQQRASSPTGDAWSATQSVQRTMTNADGSVTAFPEYRVNVSVNHTKNLRGRQRVLITWRGAQPSGGRASNPYGENGMQQEYPVVILQCRGVDDPSLPLAKQVRPESCWTTSVAQRSQLARSESDAAWVHDRDAAPADKERVSGLSPFPSAQECPGADIAPYWTRLTPFVTAKSKVYSACDAAHMPPEAAVGAAFPPSEIAAYTDVNGNGQVWFEVRSDTENESLGCSDKVACSIVVIPIAGLSCDQPSTPRTVGDIACRKGGRFLPGSSNFAGDGVDQAVSPALWWSASNWKHRFSVPITFGLPPDTCDIQDTRAPTGFYGSELLAQAALQWSPAYCLRRDRFKFQLNQMSDEAGWNLMESGGGPAAVVSSEHDTRGTDPVGYAPTALTGFSIGYVVDKPDNGGEVTNLRLNARLVAKLLTQSYVGSDLGRNHPGMSKNPIAIMTDPEFVKLNPRLSQIPQEAGATLLSLSNQSDIVEQLTSWIAHDPEAAAFVKGTPDPWGMRVNPAYKGVSLPTAEWPLLDEYIPETGNTCREQNPAVYFNQIAAPVTTMRKIAEALLDAWPNVQTRCDYDPSTELYKMGRVDRQAYGSRFMLGLVSWGDAQRYGLRSAALQAAPGAYVAPNPRSIRTALGLMKQEQKFGPFALDQAKVRKSRSAYPGTMVVYTAARLRNLPQADATKVAQFIRVATSEGQRPGSGNGELPEGYVPLLKSGPTARFLASALAVAEAIEKQTPLPEENPTDPGNPQTPPGSVTDPTTEVTVPDLSTDLPSDAPQAAPPTSPEPTAPAAQDPAALVSTPTALMASALAGRLLPALLLLGLASMTVTIALSAAEWMNSRREQA